MTSSQNSKEEILQFDALGTSWVITTPAGTLHSATNHEIINLVQTFQNEYSRFIEASYVSQLNTAKVLTNAPAELIDMLRYSLHMYTLSDGMFNISIGGVLEQHGYGKYSDDNAAVSKALDEDIQINGSTITLAPHVRIDLGGIGKGWLIDKIHMLLNGAGVTQHIINGGGDIRVGSKAEAIYIEDPRTNNGSLYGSVTLPSMSAFAASSNSKRQWTDADGTTRAHILNPRSVASASPTMQACVRAADCTTADVCATVLLLLPDEAARRTFAAMSGVEYLLISDTHIEKSAAFLVKEL